MAKHFLDDFVNDLDLSVVDTGDTAKIGKPWYNSLGDCVHFQTTSAAYFGERVDEFLTIFRRHEDREPIGFQLKGVAALIEKLPIDGLQIQVEVDGKSLRKVSVSTLLLVAFQQQEADPVRLSGYAEALRAKQRDEDEVLVAQ